MHTDSEFADFKTTPSGLKYKDIVEGDGEQPAPTDTVRAHYAGVRTPQILLHHTRVPCSVLRMRGYVDFLGTLQYPYTRGTRHHITPQQPARARARTRDGHLNV